MAFKHVTLTTGSNGLNNAVDPMRHIFEPTTRSTKGKGLTEMAVAINIDFDARSRISRRKGYTQLLTGSIHSLYSLGGYALYVIGGALTVLEKDYSHTPIRNVTINARMDYITIDNKVYYTNGIEQGYVINRASYSWIPLTYVGPQTNKEFVAPPIGQLLTYYRGRVYIAVNDYVYYSEPLAYSWFNLAENYFKLSSKITMLKPVNDGILISTENEVWFYDGTQPQEFMPRKVVDYNAIMGTAISITGKAINEVVNSTVVVFFTTPKGICMGLDGGKFSNLTEQRLVIPSSYLGAGGYLNDKYIVTLEP